MLTQFVTNGKQCENIIICMHSLGVGLRESPKSATARGAGDQVSTALKLHEISACNTKDGNAQCAREWAKSTGGRIIINQKRRCVVLFCTLRLVIGPTNGAMIKTRNKQSGVAARAAAQHGRMCRWKMIDAGRVCARSRSQAPNPIEMIILSLTQLWLIRLTRANTHNAVCIYN